MDVQSSLEQLVIRDGVLYVPAWEWNSQESSLMGHHVQTQVWDAIPLPGNEQIAPEFTVLFDNGWVISLALLFSDAPAPGAWTSGLVGASVYVGERRVITAPSSFQPLPFMPPSQFIPVIQEVAARPRWSPNPVQAEVQTMQKNAPESAGVKIEPGRGVYDANRAAALAGVPRSTLHYWARKGFYTPSISPEPRTRLWSWADLLALRAIDWFRKGKGDTAKVGMRKIREALDELVKEGASREELYRLIAVSSGGELFLTFGDKEIRARADRQGVLPDILPLVRPYQMAPDLLEPRPLLRIIPGKLHGEPHILNTRIQSATVNDLYASGYGLGAIREMYPDATLEALEEAIDFERSLLREAA